MLLNSVHEQCPNSDPKQCTVTKLGWVHYAHTQNPGRAHSAHVVGAAARTASRSRTCRACTCRNTPRQPAPRSRPHFDVTTSRQPESCRNIKSMLRHRGSQKHVATSNRCHDTTQNTPGRDTKPPIANSPMSRISCRDLTLTRPGHDLKSCHDLESFSPGYHMNFKSQPRTLQS